jgi:SWI/SNF-related matrix-associated actin-dependent regulator 1 of chromatin subfamily A
VSDGQKVAILSLFSEASVEEIMSMINITKKKIETLLALRPFATFKDLQTKLTESKLSRVIDVAKDVIYARSIVNTLLTKCEQISQKMENQVARLINSSSNDDESGKKKQQHHQLELKAQPSNLNESLSLKPYQLIGLNWLCLMHKENINGILADEMGLGKTCQTIAFLAHLFEHSPKLMHLIVVPPSTLDNWVREISTWCPEFNFTVYQVSFALLYWRVFFFRTQYRDFFKV